MAECQQEIELGSKFRAAGRRAAAVSLLLPVRAGSEGVVIVVVVSFCRPDSMHHRITVPASYSQPFSLKELLWL